MISKRMYQLLSVLPRNFSELSYEKIKLKSGLTNDQFILCLVEHEFNSVKESRLFRKCIIGSVGKENGLSLTDRGLAEVEVYEQKLEDQKAVKSSLKLAEHTLIVSIIALIISIIALFYNILDS